LSWSLPRSSLPSLRFPSWSSWCCVAAVWTPSLKLFCVLRVGLLFSFYCGGGPQSREVLLGL
jgi:hypothetical protein